MMFCSGMPLGNDEPARLIREELFDMFEKQDVSDMKHIVDPECQDSKHT